MIEFVVPLVAFFAGLAAGARLERFLNGDRPRAACDRCPDLEDMIEAITIDRDYWRAREERTADALLVSKGVATRVASPPSPPPINTMAAIARGMGVTEIDSSKQPGKAALTHGPDG